MEDGKIEWGHMKAYREGSVEKLVGASCVVGVSRWSDVVQILKENAVTKNNISSEAFISIWKLNGNVQNKQNLKDFDSTRSFLQMLLKAVLKTEEWHLP